MLLRCPDIDVYKSVLKIHVDHTPFKYILFYAGTYQRPVFVVSLR